jgi:hypothetical protein
MVPSLAKLWANAFSAGMIGSIKTSISLIARHAALTIRAVDLWTLRGSLARGDGFFIHSENGVTK